MAERKEIPNAEPTGKRLMAFIGDADNRKRIIAREKDNLQNIHLYNIGAYWVAFEYSAFQLCQLFPQCETAVFHLAEYPFPLVMASVTDRELNAYSAQRIVRRNEKDYKVFAVPALSADFYNRWRREEIDETI